MGRTILADDNIQTYVDKLLITNTWYLGLIIGKLTNQKDYAIHLVRTPEPMEDQASDDDDGETTNSSKKKRRRSQCKPSTLSEMNEQWAATHAKQVTTMLPGGLSVIGIFAVLPSAMMQSSQSKLRQMLFAIQKMEKKMSIEGMSDPVTDRVLFQMCQTTRKFTCRTIDVQDPKSSFRPADWKYLSSPEKWNRLETNLGLHLPVDVPLKSLNSTFSKQIQTGLQPFCKTVWNSITLIDGATRKETELLDQSTEKKGKGRDKGNITQQTYKCNILVKLSSTTSLSDPTVGEYGTKLVLKGRLHSRAYVTGKATVQDGEHAIKTDVVRSVLSRCELLCDDIQVVEEDAETQEVYTTPRRVFFKLPGTGLELCDYVFQDEKLQEVTERIRELLDISLSEDDIDLSWERAATDDDCLQLSQGEPADESASGDTILGNKGFKYYLVAGVGGAVAFLAAGISYLLMEET